MSLTVFENENIDRYVERSYLDYALYVIGDRALPHVGDGLKPVQRRIIYAMHQMGLTPESKFKKSARTVGEVLGKYHPHGDSACYEAMVTMAQSFNYRYPLVEGQGNWGSQDDPKSFAAMRYTESKLNKNAMPLLSEIRQGACHMVQNYDGTEREPERLPAQIPNVLLNPCSGIAVGLATDIPPHNLYEVARAVEYITKHPNASIEAIMDRMPGPDQPTGADIVSSHDELKKMYMTGNGSYRARAVWSLEDGNIVISRLPHQVSGSKVIEQIAELLTAKKLPWIDDIRDESDQKEPVRIVLSIIRKRGQDIAAVADQIMEFLFASTLLENSYRVNMNIIGLDDRPHLMNLKEILQNWIVFRKETIVRRVQHRLEKIDARLHIIDGLLVAYLNLDRVIEIIRTEDHPKSVMVAEFGITEIQADAILDMKLRHLAKLEEMTLNAERDELLIEKAGLQEIISTDERLSQQVVIELKEIANKHKNSRLSAINPKEKAKVSEIIDRGPAEPVSLIVSNHDWVRTVKGHGVDQSKLTFMTGDGLKTVIECTSHDTLYIADKNGRIYNLSVGDLPNGRGNGEPVGKWVTMESGLGIHTIGVVNSYARYLVASTIGYGYICQGSDLVTNQKKGKAFLNTGDGALLTIQPINSGQTHLIAISSDKHALLFPLEELPVLNKGKGNKILSMPKDAKLHHIDAINIESDYTSRDGVIGFSRAKLDELVGNRAKRGKKIRINLDK
jgi:topoisomerase-4 subunit A